jgi:mitogen-activated protein kinase 7
LQIFDVVIIPGVLTEVEEICIVTELMDYDLHYLITSQKKMDGEQIKLIMYQVLCGVQEMHAAHTLHRDLKPKNVLVNRDLTTKICDLGMGRGKVNTGSMLKMTMISRVATASYRAPDGILNIAASSGEVLPQDSSNSHYTTAVDVWALGCIMAEMMTCQPLFTCKENSALLTAYVDLLGCPAPEVLDRIPPSHALTHLRSVMELREGHRGRLSELFSKDDADALDLCSKLLKFDPLERISVESALNHPYFDDYDPVDSPDIGLFGDPTEDPEMSLSTCTDLILKAALEMSL